MGFRVPTCIVAASVAAVYYLSGRQRRKLRKLVPCKGQAVDKDEVGARSMILEGRAGLQTYVRRWDPPAAEDIKAAVIMMHGLALHSGTFAEAAKALRSKGVAVVSYDMYSHGLSGSFGGVPGCNMQFQDWIDQVSDVLRAARAEWYPGVPVFVFGESFGSVVAVAWCTQNVDVQEQLAGLIISGVPAKLPPDMLPPVAMLRLYQCIGKVLPLLALPDEKITDRQHFSASFGDPKCAARFWSDPLMVKKTYLGPLPGVSENTSQLLARSSLITCIPVLVLHAQFDTRTLYAGAVELFDRLGSSDKQLKSYGGMRHHLLHGEPKDVELVTSDVLDWILDRC